MNALLGSWQYTYSLQIGEINTEKQTSFHTSHRQSHHLGLSADSVWHSDFRKRTASPWRPACWLAPFHQVFSLWWAWWGERCGKLLLCSTDPALRLRNCMSAYRNKRNFIWLGETWVSPLGKAWIKAWQVPNNGNANMNSPTFPVMGSNTSYKVFYNFIQEQLWQGLWITPEECLFKVRQIHKMSYLALCVAIKCNYFLCNLFCLSASSYPLQADQLRERERLIDWDWFGWQRPLFLISSLFILTTPLVGKCSVSPAPRLMIGLVLFWVYGYKEKGLRN